MANDFFLTQWIFLGMRWVYYNITSSNVVLTIVLCTILLKLVTLFSDVSSRKYSLRMAKIQPSIEKIKSKYKNDPQKAQSEQSKLMKKEGVGMLGGCLPMLIMMPAFFCFIAAFRQWGNEQMVRVLLELNETGSSAMFDSFKFLWVNNIWQPDNGTIGVVMSAQQFLALPNLQNLIFFRDNPAALEAFKNLGFLVSDTANIPAEAIAKYNELVAPLLLKYQGYNNGWFVLPVIAAGMHFFQQWIMQKSQPAAGPQAGQGKMMLYMMPAMSFIFCLTSNSAFAIYWVMSSITSIVTNLILNKKYPRPVTEEASK